MYINAPPWKGWIDMILDFLSISQPEKLRCLSIWHPMFWKRPKKQIKKETNNQRPQLWLQSGAHPRMARRTRPPPWDLKNTIFSRFHPLSYVICIFEVCFRNFLLCGRTEGACSMVNSLRKVDFSHPTGHYTCKKIAAPPPLEKILVRPGYNSHFREKFLSRMVEKESHFCYFLL